MSISDLSGSMEIDGYHGTDSRSACRILKDQAFRISNSNKEWLGSGIYFYLEYVDAAEWSMKQRKTDSPVVVMAHICVTDDKYLDLDTEKGNYMMHKAMDILEQNNLVVKNVIDNKEGDVTASINQCNLANMIWILAPHLSMLISTFPEGRSKGKFIKDIRRYRREICIRDNSCIKNIRLCQII